MLTWCFCGYIVHCFSVLQRRPWYRAHCPPTRVGLWPYSGHLRPTTTSSPAHTTAQSVCGTPGATRWELLYYSCVSHDSLDPKLAIPPAKDCGSDTETLAVRISQQSDCSHLSFLPRKKWHVCAVKDYWLNPWKKWRVCAVKEYWLNYSMDEMTSLDLFHLKNNVYAVKGLILANIVSVASCVGTKKLSYYLEYAPMGAWNSRTKKAGWVGTYTVMGAYSGQ